MVQIFQYIFIKWLFCFLIGVIVGLVGFFNNLAVENVAGTKFVITSNMMLERRYTRGEGLLKWRRRTWNLYFTNSVH